MAGVKPNNAAALFSEADIDGGLIGGAALKAEDFLGIVPGFIARAPEADRPGRRPEN